jgi:hypothetical protein
MLYYSNGGPEHATRLLRVDAPGDDDGDDYAARHAAWFAAPAQKWTARDGWQPYPNAQLEILHLGEYFMCDRNQVPEIQGQMSDGLAPVSCVSR